MIYMRMIYICSIGEMSMIESAKKYKKSENAQQKILRERV